MESVEETLLRRLERLIEENACYPEKRIIVALAGAPGSGKSTISSALTKRFNKTSAGQLQVIPMDGFHYTKATLSTMQSSECPFRRRGAPFTFDAASFVHLVRTLSSSPVTETDEPEGAIWVPNFDHAIKDPVDRDIRISSAQKIVLLEGNYLLLDEHPWSLIRGLADETWFVDVPRDIAKTRLIARHLAAGIEPNKASAAARAETNDLLNWDLVNDKLLSPDVIVESK